MAEGGRIRLGIAGAPRGASFLAGLGDSEGRFGNVTLTAVYDPFPEARERFQQRAEVEHVCERYEQMLSLVDAVIVASPQHYHVPQAVAALEAGVHVLSEVPAAVSLEQAQHLLQAVRRSSALYMLAENYCYSRSNLIVRGMVAAGLFGQIYFAEGEYLHEMKSWHQNAQGHPTWRHY